MRTDDCLRADARAIALVTLSALLAWLMPDALRGLAPDCLWKQMGFAHCWGCGMTRGLVALAQGQLHESFRQNPVAPLVGALIVLDLVQRLRRRVFYFAQRSWLSLDPRRL